LRTIVILLLLGPMGSEPTFGRGVDGQGFCSCTERSCRAFPCLPCRPHGLVVGGAALSEDEPPAVRWILHAHTRGRGRASLRGKLSVYADPGPGFPRWPGFSGTCDRHVCRGEIAPFRGALLSGRRFAIIARYAAGAQCELRGRLEWTFQDGTPPGEFTCWDGAGATIATGALDLQLIRAWRRGRPRHFCGQ
jgi:hypothetical protein